MSIWAQQDRLRWEMSAGAQRDTVGMGDKHSGLMVRVGDGHLGLKEHG